MCLRTVSEGLGTGTWASLAAGWNWTVQPRRAAKASKPPSSALRSTLATATTFGLFLFRHAEKADAPKDDPALSEAGQRRAQALAVALKRSNVTAVYTTQLRRAQQTAAPHVHGQIAITEPSSSTSTAVITSGM